MFLRKIPFCIFRFCIVFQLLSFRSSFTFPHLQITFYLSHVNIKHSFFDVFLETFFGNITLSWFFLKLYFSIFLVLNIESLGYFSNRPGIVRFLIMETTFLNLFFKRLSSYLDTVADSYKRFFLRYAFWHFQVYFYRLSLLL